MASLWHIVFKSYCTTGAGITVLAIGAGAQLWGWIGCASLLAESEGVIITYAEALEVMRAIALKTGGVFIAIGLFLLLAGVKLDGGKKD